MGGTIRVGRIFGVEVRLHYSWFFIAFLIAFSLAWRFHAGAAALSAGAAWAAGVATALVFSGGLLVHELAHAAVARRRGVRVRAITLFALGGITRADDEAPNPRADFWIAAVGPLASALLGALFVGAAWLLEPPGAWGTALTAGLSWLGGINLAIAAFNLLPGFPLDGGRVLRAVLWRRSGSREGATHRAAGLGKALAVGLMVLGVARYLGAGGLPGVWLALLGLFLYEEAAASRRVRTRLAR